MEYKGYIANVAFDDKADVFHGEVVNIRDVVTFQGRTVSQLRKAFRDSVDDYWNFAANRARLQKSRTQENLSFASAPRYIARHRPRQLARGKA